MSSSSSDDDIFMSPIVGRRLYLVTYSQINEELFPTRESFANALQQEFNA